MSGSLCSLFGILLIVSFCEFNFIMKHFLFLKTVSGKGIFNLFLASMFLVGNDGDVWGYIVMGCLLVCGVFFMAVGCACISSYDDSDLTKKDMDPRKPSVNESDSLLTAPDAKV